MRRTTVVYSLAAVLLGAASPGVAQTPQSPATAAVPITLDEAIAQGLANSLRLAELEARQDSAEAVEQGRAAARRPSVAAQAGYTRTNHVEEFAIVAPGQPPQVVYPDVPDNYRARLDLQWLFYTGGRLDALERAAHAERQASGEDLVAARADLRLEITRAFWALVTAREAEQVLARSLDSIGAYVQDLRARLNQGLIPPNELLSAEAQQSRERLVSIEAANARGIADADLRRLLGTPGSAPLEPAARLEPVVGTSRGCRSIDRRGNCAATGATRACRARRCVARAARKRPRPACARRSGSTAAMTTRDRTRASSRGATAGRIPGTCPSTRRGRSGMADGRALNVRTRRRWRASPRRGSRISTGK